MAKKKILIFHYNLQAGGAERVLINLLKYLNRDKYDVTLMTVFGAGPYVNSVPKDIKYRYVFKHEFKGFNTMMKLLPGRLLHKLFIRGKYDIEIAYLENSPTRIIASCPNRDTKKVAWVHIEFDRRDFPCAGFRNEQEMINAYNQLDELVYVAQRTRECFVKLFPEIKVPMRVIHNVNDFDQIKRLSQEPCPIEIDRTKLNMCAVNRLFYVKGFHRLIAAFARLKDDGLIDDVKLYILGRGTERDVLEQQIAAAGLTEHIILVGFDANPYRYLSRMDLFVCSSYREGYSTATTEAISLGVPVFTTDCSGMEEILDDGKFGMIVPNDDESIYQGLKDLLTHRERIGEYAGKIKAESNFTTRALVEEYEKFFDSL